MRKIRYRFWVRDSEKMIYPEHEDYTKVFKAYLDGEEGLIPMVSLGAKISGMKGEELYEGDIIEGSRRGGYSSVHKFMVYWDATRGTFSCVDNKNIKYMVCKKLVGNIFEDPKWLERYNNKIRSYGGEEIKI